MVNRIDDTILHTEKLSSRSGGEVCADGGTPSVADIQPQDCTMALLAAEKLGGEAGELEGRIVEQKPGVNYI